jgi:hypothetical protein
MRRAHLAVILAAFGLAACSAERDVTLRDLRTFDRSPEEFGVLPAAELDVEGALALAALPEPTPGGTNRTDLQPEADAIRALGGNPAATDRGGDGALLAAAGRFGTDPAIRETLAAEDLELRRRRSRFTWQIVPEDNYARAYSNQRLNPFFWVRRYREAGVRTPSAPPQQ